MYSLKRNIDLEKMGVQLIPSRMRVRDIILSSGRKYRIVRDFDKIVIYREFNDIYDTMGMELLKHLAEASARYSNPGVKPIKTIWVGIKREIRVGGIVIVAVLTSVGYYFATTELNSALLGVLFAMGTVVLLELIFQYVTREFAEELTTDLRRLVPDNKE